MEAFFISPDQFWDWFNRPDVEEPAPEQNAPTIPAKRMKKTEDQKPKHIEEVIFDREGRKKYIIMWGRPKPGKKNKTWEGDGYLHLIGQIAHLSDLKGKLLEDPVLLDHIDHQTIEEMGELKIGSLEVQVVDKDND